MMGNTFSCTPPTMACSQSPLAIPWQAIFRADIEAEQALSTIKLGPLKSIK
ncbi:hypothetical protein D3C78_1138810 [compost metagenome]